MLKIRKKVCEHAWEGYMQFNKMLMGFNLNENETLCNLWPSFIS